MCLTDIINKKLKTTTPLFCYKRLLNKRLLNNSSPLYNYKYIKNKINPVEKINISPTKTVTYGYHSRVHKLTGFPDEKK